MSNRPPMSIMDACRGPAQKRYDGGTKQQTFAPRRLPPPSCHSAARLSFLLADSLLSIKAGQLGKLGAMQSRLQKRVIDRSVSSLLATKTAMIISAIVAFNPILQNFLH